MIFILNFFKKLFSGKDKENEPKENIEHEIDFTENENIVVMIDESGTDKWNGNVFEPGNHEFSIYSPDLMEISPFPYTKGDYMYLSIERENKETVIKCKFQKIEKQFSPPLIILDYPDNVEWKESVKRKHRRIDVDIPAKAKYNQMGEDWKSIRIKDFSMSGLSFLSPYAFVKGEEVLVQFLSLQSRMELPGKVVRVIDLEDNKYNIGIIFGELSPTVLQSISNFAWKMQKRGLE